MNRRNFLESMAIVCGAAVACPGELLKASVRPDPGFYDFDPFGSEVNRKKYRQNIIVKARQQGCTNSIFNWKNYYVDHQYSNIEMKRLVNKLEKEFWNTEFKSPLIIGAYDEKIQTIQ